eukprot:1482639-Amphidinium_carterae.2
MFVKSFSTVFPGMRPIVSANPQHWYSHLPPPCPKGSEPQPTLISIVDLFCFAEDSDSAECLALSSAAATSEELEPYGRCVGSCQARLVAGYRCAGDVPMPEDLAKALDRIDR